MVLISDQKSFNVFTRLIRILFKSSIRPPENKSKTIMTHFFFKKMLFRWKIDHKFVWWKKNFFAVFKAFLVSKYDLTSIKMLKDNINKTDK